MCANWKVVSVLAAMTTAGVLGLNWPIVAQQDTQTSRQPTVKKEPSQDVKDLKHAAEELDKLKQQLDYLKATIDAKAAYLREAKMALDQQQPKTIEQRLSAIEQKLDALIAALGKKATAGMMPDMPTTAVARPVTSAGTAPLADVVPVPPAGTALPKKH
jgi:septal ring factor EnvC (AmiA/AmiB activator)